MATQIVKTILGLILIAITIWYHRQRCTHADTFHSPTIDPIHPYDFITNSGYTIGNFSSHPQQPLLLSDYISYKKINKYIFVHYNLYKAQLAFIDLGYASLLRFTMFGGPDAHISFEEHLGFELNTYGFNKMNYAFTKKDFNLTIHQFINASSDETVTYFKMNLKRISLIINAELTHIMKNDQCFSITRVPAIISHKCYGGRGDGKILIQHIDYSQNTRKFKSYYLTNELTRSVFDGLRGGGWHWKFVWAMGSGFNKNQFYANNHTITNDRFIGINFGSMNSQGQDFIFWCGQIIPVKGLIYQFDESASIKSNINFSGEQPKFQFIFTVEHTLRIFKDMGVIKVDMVRLEGYWSGWIEIEGKINEFNEVAGLVESSDSLF